MKSNRRAAAAMKTACLAFALGGSMVLSTSGAGAAGTAGSTADNAQALLESQDPGATQQRTNEKERPADALAGIIVSFKLDPRLTQGLYMGERWVSPPTYTRVGEGMTVTVDARAVGVDGKGRSMGIRPEWRAADPEMVTVTPSQGNEVKITVQRAGQSSLQVASQGISRELAIKATYRNKAILVEIVQ